MIQKNCRHIFKLAKSVSLKKSKVENVFIAYDMNGYIIRLNHEPQFEIKCQKCSLVENVTPDKVCPKCLTAVIQISDSSAYDQIDKYFGRDENKMRDYRIGCWLKLYKCTACDFMAAGASQKNYTMGRNSF